jgi:hypothetical protein
MQHGAYATGDLCQQLFIVRQLHFGMALATAACLQPRHLGCDVDDAHHTPAVRVQRKVELLRH